MCEAKDMANRLANMVLLTCYCQRMFTILCKSSSALQREIKLFFLKLNLKLKGRFIPPSSPFFNCPRHVRKM